MSGALGNPESAPFGSAMDASVTVNGEGNHKGCPYTEILWHNKVPRAGLDRSCMGSPCGCPFRVCQRSATAILGRVRQAPRACPYEAEARARRRPNGVGDRRRRTRWRRARATRVLPDSARCLESRTPDTQGRSAPRYARRANHQPVAPRSADGTRIDAPISIVVSKKKRCGNSWISASARVSCHRSFVKNSR